jgi:hypothetical protein
MKSFACDHRGNGEVVPEIIAHEDLQAYLSKFAFT